MKYLKAGIPAFTLIASLVGIYVVPRTAPYTHIAAAAVAIATALTIWQNLGARESAEATRQRLSTLTSSRREWKDAVKAVVVKVAAAQGYTLNRTLADTSDFDDPAGGRIFVFAPAGPGPVVPNALLVFTPDDFAYLAQLDPKRLDAEVHRIAFGHWGTATLTTDLAAVSARIAESAACLYSLRHFGIGFKVMSRPDQSTGSIEAHVGPVTLRFGRSQVEELLDLPYILMTLKIWEAVVAADGVSSDPIVA